MSCTLCPVCVISREIAEYALAKYAGDRNQAANAIFMSGDMLRREMARTKAPTLRSKLVQKRGQSATPPVKRIPTKPHKWVHVKTVKVCTEISLSLHLETRYDE